MPMLTALCRLGRDAEVKKVGSDSVCNLALAYNLSRKDKDGKKPSVWVDAALWGKRAETLAPYLKKGISVVVSISDPYIRTFKKNDGTDSFVLAGQISEIEFAGGPAKVAEPKPAPTPAPVPEAAGFGPDDDIPF